MSTSSVRKSIMVNAAQEIAFRVFTSQMTAWWPAEHHIGKSPLKEIVLEPRVGGRWAERCADGSECDWGRVLAWEPPGRVVLAWQLDADFAYDPNLETEVEIRFVAESPKRTRVELEHRNLERFGARQDELRAAFDSDGGWALGLSRYARAATNAGKRGFLLRLIPPRPTFAADMNDDERRAMQEHVAYWTEQLGTGAAIAFGPVADPKGGWGVAIAFAEDDAAIRKMTDDDPVVRHRIGARYEILPMPSVVTREGRIPT